jgi:hypothetical protein
MVDELTSKKQALMNEINSYVEAAKQPRQAAGPAIDWVLDQTNDGPCVSISASQGVVKCIIAYSDELFTGGTFAHHPANPSSHEKLQFISEKNIEAEVMVKVLVGASASAKSYQIHEFNVLLPKFSMFTPQVFSSAQPNGVVKF